MLVLLNGGGRHALKRWILAKRHSLMLVLLNGGPTRPLANPSTPAPLADACVTEWRRAARQRLSQNSLAPLADACVTEWRAPAMMRAMVPGMPRHSLMLVLLNGGQSNRTSRSTAARATR